MEVKDLIKDDLTEEQQKQLELYERRNKFKVLQKFVTVKDGEIIESKEYKKVVNAFEKKVKDLEKEIDKLVDERRDIDYKVVATKTELDKSLVFYDFQIELMKALGNTDAEEILKADLKENADATYTHVMNKIEEMYDVPVYTKLDIVKQKRIDYMLVGERLQRMVSFYADTKDTGSNPNPYEDESEEFKALTDVS